MCLNNYIFHTVHNKQHAILTQNKTIDTKPSLHCDTVLDEGRKSNLTFKSHVQNQPILTYYLEIFYAKSHQKCCHIQPLDFHAVSNLSVTKRHLKFVNISFEKKNIIATGTSMP